HDGAAADAAGCAAGVVRRGRLVGGEDDGGGVQRPGAQQQLELLALARPLLPGQWDQDRLGAAPGERGKLLREADVVAGRDAESGTCQVDGDQVVDRGYASRLVSGSCVDLLVLW